MKFGLSEEMSGLRHGDGGTAPLFQGERLEVRVVGVVVCVDGREGARGTADRSFGQGISFAGLCSGAAERREPGKAGGCRGPASGGEEDEPLSQCSLRPGFQPTETLMSRVSCPSC